MKKRALTLALVAVVGCSERAADRTSARNADPLEPFVRGAAALEAKTSAQGIAVRPRADFSARLPTRADAPLELHGKGIDVRVTALDVRPVDCEVRSDRVVCPDGAPGTEVVHAQIGPYVEELRVLRSPSSPPVARYRIEAPDDAVVRVREGRIEVTVRDVVVLATAKVVAVDANGVRRDLTLENEHGIVTATLDVAGLAYPIVVDPAWSTVASMAGPRGQHGAALLTSGKVVVAGGRVAPSASILLSSAEIYDPVANTWSAAATLPESSLRPLTASLKANRAFFGFGNFSKPYVYDGTANKWTATAAPPASYGSILALADGRVLAAGGRFSSPSDLAAIYDPATDAWTTLPTLKATRVRPNLVQLTSTKVLALGGSLQTAGGARDEVDVLDLGTLTWSSVGKTLTARFDSITVPLSSGGALFVGGSIEDASGGGAATNETEVYDPIAKTFGKGPTMSLGVYAPHGFASPRGPWFVGVAGRVAGYVEADKRWAEGPTAAPLANLADDSVVTGLLSGGALATGLYDAAGTLYTAAAEVLQLAGKGASCSIDTDCASFACTDGVCCERTCLGACEQCGAGGVCGGRTGAILAGHDACGAYKTCTAGACTATCTTDDVCADGFHCSAGACTTNGEVGSSCTKASECKSGFCTDGVCCVLACNGACEACDVAGKLGSCVAVTGAPHGTRATCGDGTTCGARCDGADRAACHPSPAGTTCGADACKDGVETHASTCDGAGSCADVSKPCNEYVCGDVACKSSCAVDTDCKSGFVCLAGKCREPDSSCSADGSQEIDVDGRSTDCRPFLCVGRKCATSCAVSSDCAPGAVCDGNQCMLAPAGATDDGGGCVVSRTPGAHTGAYGVLFGAVFLSLCASRRRRSWAMLASAFAIVVASSGCSSSSSEGAVEDASIDTNVDSETPLDADAAEADSGGDALADVDAGSPVDVACAAYASAYCKRLDECTHGYAVAVHYRNLDGCRTRQALACARRLGAPGSTMKPADVTACASATGAAACRALDFEGFNFATACTPPKGSLALGSGCFVHEQCASGYCAGGDCGRCAMPPATTVSCPICPEGTVCAILQYLGGASCKAPPAPGGACSGAEDCDREDRCVAGACVPRKALDAVCDPAGPYECELGLVCSTTTKLCEKTPVNKVGDPCSSAFACAGGSYCTGSPSTCVPSPADGDSCVGTPPCMPPATCTGGKCTIDRSCAATADAGSDGSDG